MFLIPKCSEYFQFVFYEVRMCKKYQDKNTKGKIM